MNGIHLFRGRMLAARFRLIKTTLFLIRARESLRGCRAQVVSGVTFGFGSSGVAAPLRLSMGHGVEKLLLLNAYPPMCCSRCDMQ
jgi:hypothetical protein